MFHCIESEAIKSKGVDYPKCPSFDFSADLAVNIRSGGNVPQGDYGRYQKTSSNRNCQTHDSHCGPNICYLQQDERGGGSLDRPLISNGGGSWNYQNIDAGEMIPLPFHSGSRISASRKQEMNPWIDIFLATNVLKSIYSIRE